MVSGRSGLVSRILVCAAVLSCALNAQTSSTVTLGATPAPSNFGQRVTLTATVTSGATGKVTFYDGTSVLGTSTISGSQAMFMTALLPSGVHSLHAYYFGNSALAPSNSLTIAQTVLGQASLSFKMPVLYPAGLAPQAISIGDFNLDGKPDLIVADNDSKATVLLGNGDGTFQPIIPFRAS